jgi:hypothetical protein
MLIAVAAAGVLLAQAAPPASPSAPGPAPAAAKAEKPKTPKLICVQERSTDSFIAKRVCRTPEQIEAERQAARNGADDVRDRASSCRGPTC